MKADINIGGTMFRISGDSEYLNRTGKVYEPFTIYLLSAMVSEESRVLDIGANIGLTALALSEMCPGGKIAAFEPVSRTFSFLQENLSSAGTTNVTAFNFALGAKKEELVMTGHPDFLSASFVADKHSINDDLYFSERVPVFPLDDILPITGLDRVDVIKVDVEGFELEVFIGARKTLSDFRPLVFMEMNHWCLGMFRRMTIPEFRERLLSIFPEVYAIQGNSVLDFRDEKAAYHVAHEHATKLHYMNILAGFDRDAIFQTIEKYRENSATRALPTQVDYDTELFPLAESGSPLLALISEFIRSNEFQEKNAGGGITEDDITSAYRLFLRRDPEGNAAIQYWINWARLRGY